MVDVLSFLLGVAMLAGGADALVRGASALSLRMGISPLVIGLTVVAVGTSAPEIVTGVLAAASGHDDMAVGNVVGSNIFNILLVLGGVVLLAPLAVAQRLVRIEVPLLIGLSVVTLLMARDGMIGLADGSILLVGFLAYTYFAVRSESDESPDVLEEYDDAFARPPSASVWIDAAWLGLGILALGIGSWFVVNGASGIARAAGISELVIGLTVVAACTGLPELITCVVATLRGERDIAVGNILGSNIANILLVLGTLGVFAPGGTPVAAGVIHFDLPVMIGTALVCLPIFTTGYRIDRWEGVVLLGYYVAYCAILLLDATDQAALPLFRRSMLFFVIPMTVLGFSVAIWNDRRSKP